jgi:acyl carrier protein
MKATIKSIKNTIVETDVLDDVSNIDNIKSDVLLSEQGIDSLDIVNVYLSLEEKFGIKIPDEDLDRVQTIGAIVEYINNKM